MGGIISQEVITGEKILELGDQKIKYIVAPNVRVFSRKCDWCPYVADTFCQEGSCNECTVRQAWLLSIKEDFEQLGTKWPVSKNPDDKLTEPK
jgi:hypothetical protein